MLTSEYTDSYHQITTWYVEFLFQFENGENYQIDYIGNVNVIKYHHLLTVDDYLTVRNIYSYITNKTIIITRNNRNKIYVGIRQSYLFVDKNKLTI